MISVPRRLIRFGRDGRRRRGARAARTLALALVLALALAASSVCGLLLAARLHGSGVPAERPIIDGSSFEPARLDADEGPAPLVATLPAALDTIQSAFLSNDAGRLARLFARRGPVFVSIPPLEAGTFLAPGPLKAFLDRLVRDRVSVAFELPARVPDVAAGDRASTFVKVKWTHRPPASATLQVDYLHLALRYAAENAEWRIVEIKTSPR